MAERQAQGTWVEIHAVLLEAGARAPQVPPDTRQVPLEMRSRGFLAAPAALGERATIITAAGRRVEGKLVDAHPAYAHGFGAPIAALLTIGPALRAMLKAAADR